MSGNAQAAPATVAASIRSALSSLNLPCTQVRYSGTADTYLTFNCFSIPGDFGDDAPGADIWTVQLHLYAPYTVDTTQTRASIKTLLLAAGFTAPEMTDATENTRAGDGTEQHIVFEFETATGWGDA